MQHRDRDVQLAPELRPDLFFHVRRKGTINVRLQVPVDVVAVGNNDIRPEGHTASEKASPRRHIEKKRLAFKRRRVVAAATRIRKDAQGLRFCIRSRKRPERPCVAERRAAGISDPQLVLSGRLER